MVKGKVKFYDKKKAFGFINVKNKREDVHIGPDSYKGFLPMKGDIVTFEIVQQRQGPHARQMKLIKRTKKSKSVTKPSSISTSYQLPSDTREYVMENINSFQNFNLLYQKYIRVDEKNKFLKPSIKGLKFMYLDQYREKFEKNLQQKAKSIQFIGFKAKTASRLLIGFGNPSVIETNLELEHIYGFPYIPGSALKGILSNYLINEYFTNQKGEASEEKALKDQGFCDIFGCPKESFYEEERRGKVLFLDSLPNENPKLEKDIMTPHFGKYYNSEGQKPPADYYTPNVIDFLGISKNIEFHFYLGIKKSELKWKISKDSDLETNELSILDFVKKKLMEALEFQGLGAKTAVGYGYFYDFGTIVV